MAVASATTVLRACRRIAVVRALPGLGDALCAVPALRALRAGAPTASIVVVGLPVAGLLRDRFAAYVDEIVDAPGFPGLPELPEDPMRLAAFADVMHARAFDLAIQLHGDGTVSLPFARLIGAGRLASFHPADQAPPSDCVACVPFDDDEPEPLRLLRLVEALGGAGTPDLEFPVLPDDRARAARLAGDDDRPLAVVHPGAARADRRWPAAHFAEVATVLREEGMRVVVTGTRGETGVTAEVAAGSDGVDLGGRTDVAALAGLLADAAVLVCNDTGVSHLAAALATPSVVLFTTSNAARWAPLDRRRHRVVQAPVPPPAVAEAALMQARRRRR